MTYFEQHSKFLFNLNICAKELLLDNGFESRLICTVAYKLKEAYITRL